ncbi:MAG TPA: NAD-dependent epimerase/dehydratase family protein [Pseudomonadales bacterium]|nr:NAD-dependent epimerase/dehydratase family protein [Pseudomonadales bacterium]
MRILVTGATGFVGGRYVERLQQSPPFQVRFCGRDKARGLALAQAGGEFVAGDLTDINHAMRVCEGVDVVVHCAGLAGAWGDYDDYFRANVASTWNLLQACQIHGAKRFIFISSPSIYFEPSDRLNITEQDLPKRLFDSYARSKYEAEQYIYSVHSEHFTTAILRPRMVVGAGDTRILPQLIEARRSGLLRQVGRGKNQVSMTSINNLMDAIDACVKAPAENLGEAFNIADAEPVNLWSTINYMLQQMDMPPVKRSVPYWLAYSVSHLVKWIKRFQQSDREPRLLPLKVAIMAKSMTLNIEKAQHRLAYQPQQTTLEAIDEFIAWYKPQLLANSETV